MKNEINKIWVYFELAYKMHEAGFKTNTFFYHSFWKEEGEIIHEVFSAYGMSFDFVKKCKRTNVICAPTLGEIDLPEDLIIAQLSVCWVVLRIVENNIKVIIELESFQTELEARCHAWLWANENEKGGAN